MTKEQLSPFFYLQKRQDFVMVAIFANCLDYKIEGKVDGTASKQVKNELSCFLVICDYGKVQELYETSATWR